MRAVLSYVYSPAREGRRAAPARNLLRSDGIRLSRASNPSPRRNGLFRADILKRSIASWLLRRSLRSIALRGNRSSERLKLMGASKPTAAIEGETEDVARGHREAGKIPSRH